MKINEKPLKNVSFNLKWISDMDVFMCLTNETSMKNTVKHSLADQEL